VNELLVSADEEGLRIGILEDKRIIELHHEKVNKAFTVGDILLARVKKLVPGLNAAFVEVGHPKDAFLHYLDLGPQVKSLLNYVKTIHTSADRIRPLGEVEVQPDIDKNGKMASVLKPNQPILVQVVKEAISTKGPRLTSEISIPGQYMIIKPFSNEVSISRKIRSVEEKKRLRVIVESLQPKNFGIIVRTASEGRDHEALEADLNDLLQKWDAMCRAITNAKPPRKVLSEQDRTTSILRDMLSSGFDSIVTDDKESYDEIHEYLKRKMPDDVRKLKLHKGPKELFESRGVDRQIEAAFGKTVTMQNGAYLVIEHTEALHVIDVNSGSKNLSGDTLEDNALKTNITGAKEIARQLRLRDMGGIIVVDFIDLKRAENKKILTQALRDAMKTDRAKHSILPMSKFGLVQITRQRVRPELNLTKSEECPSCRGTGKVQSTMLVIDEIENNVDFLMRQNKEKKLTLKVNPFVEAYLKKGIMNKPRTWMLRYKRSVKIVSDKDIPFTSVVYLNSKDEEVKF
jgi:ribonuclease G